MVSTDEIEDLYQKDLEQLDKEYISFLTGDAKKKPKDLGAYYKKKLNVIVTRYEKAYQEYFEEQRKGFARYKGEERFKSKDEEEEPEDALDMSKPFEAKHLDLSLSAAVKRSLAKDLKKFKRAISRRKFFRKYVPRFFFLNGLRLRNMFRRFRLVMKDRWFHLSSQTQQEFFDLMDFFRDNVLALVSNVKIASAKLISFVKSLSGSKNVEVTEEKSKDAKIAEKLLSKK